MLAESQGGYFTASQAKSIGYADSVHGYHVSSGNWVKAYRGIYRLASFPEPKWPNLIVWSLWSRDRSGQPQGVFSHQTALELHRGDYNLSTPLHLTVPKHFRKNCEMPKEIILHKADLADHEIERYSGYFVTTRERTRADTQSVLSFPRADRYDDVICAGED